MLLAVLLRLLVLLVATELSGATHALIDAASSAGGTALHDDDCDDEAGHECPPGCPNCHCTHGARVSVAFSAPRVEVQLEEVPTLHDEGGFVPLDGLPPKSADLARLYRPPRTLALS